jgi:hypothetical protein
MDTNLLRSWLGLPPGPWPPGERDLLGLPPGGAVDPAAAERCAMDRMGRLRAQQLVHPDLVTEGMNRLAQALIAVTSAAPAPAPAPVPPAPVAEALDLTPAATTATVAPAPVLEAEAVLEAEPVALAPTPLAPPPVEAPRYLPAPPPEPLPEVWVGPTPDDRRDAYRELAALRAMRRAWEKLRPFLADLSARLATAGDVFAFLEAVHELRTALAHPGLPRGYPEDVAPRAAVIVRQPLTLAVFRSLTAPQRVALAREWGIAEAKLHARMTALREALHRATPPRETLTPAGVADELGRNPEWLLVLATVFVFLIALLRLAFS